MLDIDVDLKLLRIIGVDIPTVFLYLSRRVKILQGNFGLLLNSLLLTLELRIYLYFCKGITFMLNFLLLFKIFYRPLHQGDGFDVSMVLKVEKSPKLSLNQFSL